MIALMPVVPLLLTLLLAALPREAPPKAVILVELFTSEGCSSCPPADTHLTKLLREQPIADVEIVPLSFHVDYWNHQGWRDPFSARAFSVRQESYSKIFGDGRVYTPQMVVDGHDEFNGSDEGAARKFLQAAAERPHLPLRIDARAQGPTVRLRIDLPAAPPDVEPVDVVVALTEDDLTSAVQRGENGGRTLTHSAVVRKLESLGTLEREAFVADGQLSIDRTWKTARMRAVTWLQGRRTRHVYGTAAAPLLQ